MNKQQKLLPDEINFAKEIVGVPVEEEMQESFLAYSLSVITSRAIPDVKDGLKPVQRRILYTMLRMGLRPENPHRKQSLARLPHAMGAGTSPGRTSWETSSHRGAA